MKLSSKLFRYATTLFVSLFLFIGLLNIFSAPMLPGILGLKGYTVISESMAKTLNVGDYILIKKTDPHQLKKNDIITFQQDQMLVTHRIVGFDQTKILTKGDNNPIPDMEKVDQTQVVGRYLFHIPLLGYFMMMLQNPIWFSLLIGGLVFCLLVLILF